MVRSVPYVVFVCASVIAAAPAGAQDFFRTIIGPPRPAPQAQPPAPKAVPKAEKAEPKQAKIVETPPAYHSEMSRLAEILGALHYLHPICGARDGARWRTEMQNLIDAEQAPPERRDRLIANFNRSFVAYEQTYRTCTPAASLAIRRYLDEGAKLSREIATRYGN